MIVVMLTSQCQCLEIQQEGGRNSSLCAISLRGPVEGMDSSTGPREPNNA